MSMNFSSRPRLNVLISQTCIVQTNIANQNLLSEMYVCFSVNSFKAAKTNVDGKLIQPTNIFVEI